MHALFAQHCSFASSSVDLNKSKRYIYFRLIYLDASGRIKEAYVVRFKHHLTRVYAQRARYVSRDAVDNRPDISDMSAASEPTAEPIEDQKPKWIGTSKDHCEKMVEHARSRNATVKFMTEKLEEVREGEEERCRREGRDRHASYKTYNSSIITHFICPYQDIHNQSQGDFQETMVLDDRNEDTILCRDDHSS